MAAKRGPDGKFLPGNKSGGRPELPEDIREMRAMEFVKFIKDVIEVRKITVKQMKDKRRINVDNMPLGKRAIVNAYASNNHKAIKNIEDRLFGMAQQFIDLNLGEDAQVNFIISKDLLPPPKKKKGTKGDKK